MPPQCFPKHARTTCISCCACSCWRAHLLHPVPPDTPYSILMLTGTHSKGEDRGGGSAGTRGEQGRHRLHRRQGPEDGVEEAALQVPPGPPLGGTVLEPGPTQEDEDVGEGPGPDAGGAGEGGGAEEDRGRWGDPEPEAGRSRAAQLPPHLRCHRSGASRMEDRVAEEQEGEGEEMDRG